MDLSTGICEEFHVFQSCELIGGSFTSLRPFRIRRLLSALSDLLPAPRQHHSGLSTLPSQGRSNVLITTSTISNIITSSLCCADQPSALFLSYRSSRSIIVTVHRGDLGPLDIWSRTLHIGDCEAHQLNRHRHCSSTALLLILLQQSTTSRLLSTIFIASPSTPAALLLLSRRQLRSLDLAL